METDFDYRLLNRKALKSLYGKRSIGTSNRRDIKVSITPATIDKLKQIVEFGNGKYGSSVIELAIKLFIELVDVGEGLDTVADEIKRAVKSPYLETNLLRLSRKLAENSSLTSTDS